MAKKANKKHMDATVEYSTEFEFKKEYEDWKRACGSHSAEKIMSVGRTVKGERQRKNPPNLYAQLEEHVTTAFIRPKSSNTGTDGTFKLLQEIDKFMLEQYKGVLLEAHRPKLLSFKDKLEKFDGKSTLNPRRLYFTRPTNWEERGKKKGQAIGKETEKIYGHYADEYYEAKYKGKKGYQGKAPSSWYSTDIDGPQNPPLAQALFGKGDLITGKGLIDIINLAIEELEKPIDNIEIVPKRPSSLSPISSFRKHVQSLLRNKAMFGKNGKPRLNSMAQSFVGMTFVVGQKATGGKRMASPNKIIAFAAQITEPSGDIKTFSLSKPFGASAMASLIKKVIGRDTYKLRWGEYLNMKGMKVPQKEKEDKVQKSWVEYLWR